MKREAEDSFVEEPRPKRSQYSSYSFNVHRLDESTFPVFNAKEQIKDALRNCPVVLVKGSTGCGKTTQIPQYILDDCRESRTRCKIAVTQPRRIAAIGAANRVSWERGWQPPAPVGYAVALDSKVAPDTIITYMTTGVLVQQATSPGSLDQYTHVIIDEIHERDIDIDLMLLVLRDKLCNNAKFQVILMSATINTTRFHEYFSEARLRVKTVEIPSQTQRFVVDTLYLESLNVDPETLNTIQQSLADGRNAEFRDDIARVACLKMVDFMSRRTSTDATTFLVFLPGKSQIQKFHRILYDVLKEHGMDFDVWEAVYLHSGCSSEEQLQVLGAPDKKIRVVLATNIAESSITVKDVELVFDFCLVKTSYTENETNFRSLRLEWASKSQCKQRAGRTGRLCNGVACVLVPSSFYANLREDSSPEIMRTCLEEVVLKCKRLSEVSPRKFLSRAIDRPNLNAIDTAVKTLKQIGGLSLFAYNSQVNNFIIDNTNGDITELGIIMDELPVSPRLAYLIMLGRAFDIVELAITAAAGLTVRHVFKEQVSSHFSKMKHSGKEESEVFAFVTVYEKFCRSFPAGFGNASLQKDRENWANLNGVNVSGLAEIDKRIEQIKEQMEKKQLSFRYNPVSPKTPETKALLLKMALAGAFYPHYFKSLKTTTTDNYENELLKCTGGHDPFSTVLIDKFPPTNHREVYMHRLSSFLALNGYKPLLNCNNGNKIYATYDPTITGTIGNISKGVYHAISLRRTKIPVEMFTQEQEEEILTNWNEHLSSLQLTPTPPNALTPSPRKTQVPIHVLHIESPSEFWVCPRKFAPKLDYMTTRLNDEVPPRLDHNQVIPDLFCLAMYNRFYHRARIIAVHNPDIIVHFVDYGNYLTVSRDEVRGFTAANIAAKLDTEPVRTFHCRLDNIGYNPWHALGWSDGALNSTKNFVDTYHQTLLLQISSVVDGVVSGQLLSPAGDSGNFYNLTQHLQSNPSIPYAVIRPDGFECDTNAEQRRNSRRVPEDLQFALAVQNAQKKGEYSYRYVAGPRPRSNRPPFYACSATSPLQVKLMSMTESGAKLKTIVDQLDVNSIMLDQTPHLNVQKVVVASAVKTVEKSLVVHDTTVMPQADGISSLIPLLFSPTVLLRLSESGDGLGGALCGLGAHTKILESILQQHDIELNFDHVIDLEDINMINIVRDGICKMMYKKPERILATQRTLIGAVNSLLGRRRLPVNQLCDLGDWSVGVVGGELGLMGDQNTNHLRPIRKDQLVTQWSQN